jgi:hypothetical protein
MIINFIHHFYNFLVLPLAGASEIAKQSTPRTVFLLKILPITLAQATDCLPYPLKDFYSKNFHTIFFKWDMPQKINRVRGLAHSNYSRSWNLVFSLHLQLINFYYIKKIFNLNFNLIVLI